MQGNEQEKIAADLLAPNFDKHWDVIVIGAGPAGAVSACLLARRGQKVLLVDKAQFPRDKVCGSCLSARTIGFLGEAGLGHLIKDLGAQPINDIKLCTAIGASKLTLPVGFALSRQSLDMAIIEEAKAAGVVFLAGISASVGAVDGYRRTVILESADNDVALQATCILVCDGVNGRALHDLSGAEKELFKPHIAKNSRIGAGAVISLDPSQARQFYKPGTIYMALDKSGYVGLVCMEDNKVDLAGAFDATFTRKLGSPKEAAAKILRNAGLPFLPAFEDADWLGTAPYTRHRKKLAGQRLFIVGDAASYGEPFTGEGIGWATKSALLVVPLVEQALAGWDNSLISNWQKIHQKQVQDKQRLSLLLGRLLRSEQLISMLIPLLKIAPMVAGPIIKTINSGNSGNSGNFELSTLKKVGLPK
jgi:flavin-dependent dehydrogenase